MLAPKPFTRPRASDPAKARELYEHRLNKKYPFLRATGYDWDEMLDYRPFGKIVNPENKPIVRGMTHDTAYFYLHSSQVLSSPNSNEGLIFIHLIHNNSGVVFRGLLFEDYSAAYRYANAYGCTIVKKADVTVDYVQYITGNLTDIDVFVDITSQIADRRRMDARTR